MEIRIFISAATILEIYALKYTLESSYINYSIRKLEDVKKVRTVILFIHPTK